MLIQRTCIKHFLHAKHIILIGPRDAKIWVIYPQWNYNTIEKLQCVKCDKLILIMEIQMPRIAKAIIRHKVRGLTLSHIKMYPKAVIIKTM